MDGVFFLQLRQKHKRKKDEDSTHGFSRIDGSVIAIEWLQLQAGWHMPCYYNNNFASSGVCIIISKFTRIYIYIITKNVWLD